MNSFNINSLKYFSSLEKNYIKKNGIAYTPRWIASHMTKQAFKQWMKFNAGKTPENVADICCGTGVFIKELDNIIEDNNFATKISAFDIDQGAVNFATKYFAGTNSIRKIEQKDILLDIDDLFGEEKFKYDIIVSNPPYINHKEIEESYKSFLTNNYYSANSGSFDLSVVFVEKILCSLKDGGVGSVILSNKFMTSNYGKSICEILSTKCNIIKIENFGDLQLFDGLTTYTCIITFINSKPARKHTLSIADIGEKNRVSSMPKMVNETIMHTELEKHPWSFQMKDDHEILNKMKNNGMTVLEVFEDIQQGVRTGANDIFIVKEGSDIYSMDSDIIMPFVSGEDIIEFELKETKKKVVYPYSYVDSIVYPLSEVDLKNKYNDIYQYLVEKKISLKSRSLQGNTNWFEFSRSQSLNSVYKRKILIREMMPKAIFSADIKGEYVFSSGYALIGTSLSDKELICWSATLSTPVMEFFMRHIGTQLHSGWFRLMKNHICNLYLPRVSDKEFDIIYIEAQKENPNINYINDIVASAFNLTENEKILISHKLEKIHQKSRPNDVEYKSEDIYEPVKLPKYSEKHIDREDLRQAVTFTQNKKIPIHNWYKYTQGFSPNLVNYIIDEFNLNSKSKVLDPFNGCGTTLVTCAYRGIPSVGVEISPLMCLVTEIKSRSWNIEKLRKSLDFKVVCSSKEKSLVFEDYFMKAYSKKILESLKELSSFIMLVKDEEVRQFYTMGLLSILENVSKIRKHGSHYRYLNNSDSVGLQKINIDVISDDADIYEVFTNSLINIYEDICTVGGNPKAKVKVIEGSSLNTKLKSESIDAIITSPPYLNRNNYISQQKAELDILEFISDKSEYKELVKSTFRSHTDSDLRIEPLSKHSEINSIIKNMSLESGNNPKIPHMICGYFDDLEMSLNECYRLLKFGGRAAFVVGNTRWGGVVVPIDHLLAKFAEDIGFNVDSIFVTRLKGNSPQQMKKFGKIPVRESIVILTKK